MTFFQEVVQFHGHVCPGLAFGYRVALVALAEIPGAGHNEALVAVVENRSCAVDAIQVVTGCTCGKGNLVLNDYGKQVYSFMKGEEGHGIRIAVIWQPPAELSEMKEVWQEFSSGNRRPQIMAKIQAHKGRKVRTILEARPEELFTVEKRQFIVPEPAQVYESLRCTRCHEKVMAPMARVAGDEVFCIPCQNMQNGK